MPRFELDLKPVQHITADALGKPGERVFYLQGWRATDPQPVTIIIEKVQLQGLVTGIAQMLGEVARQHPNLPVPMADFDGDKMRIQPPLDPQFRAGEMGLGYDEESDLMLLLAREIVPEDGDIEDAAVVRFWCNRRQASQLAAWSSEVINQGRKICPQCGEPMEAEGHFCPKKNGHKKK